MSKRFLIVNADDFGQSHGINRGIIESHEHGIVTSTSLMVRWPAAAEAADYARTHPEFSVGLHVDLGEMFYRGGDWSYLYEVVPVEDENAVAREVEQQLQEFLRLMGRPPSHFDSHQHVHRSEPCRSILLEHARRLGVPLRDCCPSIRYCGEFYGQTGKGLPYPDAIGVDGLSAILRSLDNTLTELGCHPALSEDVDSMYRTERNLEVVALCDPRVRVTLANEKIVLRSFHYVKNCY